MNTCKFCAIEEGSIGRSGKAVHINRDNLCGPCATLLDKVKYQPDTLTTETFDYFLRQCKMNQETGRFIPVAQRKLFKVKWHCRKCGTTREIDKDPSYSNHCITCAGIVRTEREMPPRSNRKTRSDKGGKHASPYANGIMTKLDRRIK